MKRWSRILLMFALVSAVGITPKLFAGPACVVTLQWNASPSPGIAGYDIYYGVSGSSVTNMINAGLSLSCNVSGLAPSTTYFFYVVDYDAYGDVSPPSNVLLFTTPPISPLQISQPTNGVINIQLLVAPGTAYEVEYTPTLSPPAWTVLTNAVGNSSDLVSINEPMNGPQGFFRALIVTNIQTEIAPQVSATLGFSPLLQWSPSPTPGTTGYTVYYGVSGSSVTNQINVGSALSLTVTGLVASTPYFFYVVADNSSGTQSAPSQTFLYTTPPISPLQLSQSNRAMNIRFHVAPGAACQVQYTTTLTPPTWTALTNAVADTNGLVIVIDPANGPQRFYRAAVGTGMLPVLQAALPTPGFSYTLQWAQSLDVDALGYIVSYSASGSSITNQIKAGTGFSTTITGLQPSTTYVFSISAFDLLGVLSAPLNVVTYTTPPISPLEIGWGGSGPVLQFRVAPRAACHVEYTTSLSQPAWTVLTSAVADTNGLVTVADPRGSSGARFYRASVP